MALDTLGLSFAPLSGAGTEEERRRRRSPVQEAIRLLSLRLPKREEMGAIVPEALLSGLGGSVLPTPNPSVAAMLEQILGPSPQTTPTGLGGPSPVVPPPSESGLANFQLPPPQPPPMTQTLNGSQTPPPLMGPTPGLMPEPSPGPLFDVFESLREQTRQRQRGGPLIPRFRIDPQGLRGSQRRIR